MTLGFSEISLELFSSYTLVAGVLWSSIETYQIHIGGCENGSLYTAQQIANESLHTAPQIENDSLHTAPEN
jgi:hypothetical protein